MSPGIPRPLKILIVDDDRTFNRTTELRLSRAGFLTEAVFDGEAALKALGEKHFDLVILDLVMPGLSGFDVLREVRKENLPVTIVVLSLLHQEEDVRLTKELGASEFFVKSAPAFMDDIVKYAAQLSMK